MVTSAIYSKKWRNLEVVVHNHEEGELATFWRDHNNNRWHGPDPVAIF